MESGKGTLTMGLDLGSQSAKLVYIDTVTQELIGPISVAVDELAHRLGIQTEKGMIVGPNGEYTLPDTVIVAEIEEIMQLGAHELRKQGRDPSEVRYGSLSVQGHKLVFGKKGLEDILQNPNLTIPLHLQVEGQFACDGNTWMDSSTKKEVLELSDKFSQEGLNVIALAERYPAPQLAKRRGEILDTTDYVMVGNAFGAFVITGKRTFSGPGDAAASGIVNLETLQLDRVAMDIIDPHLYRKVANVTPSGEKIGRASSFFQTMGYTNLEIFTGDQDNIKSGAYLIFNPSILQISLGTSFTASMLSKNPIPGFAGNFGSNDANYPYLLLLCKQNGANAQAEVLKAYGFADTDYTQRTTALQSTVSGNNNAMALPWYLPEIVPFSDGACGLIRNGYQGNFNQDMRAVIEGNAASLKIWADHYFSKCENITGFAAAGGVAKDSDIMSIWVDILGVPRYQLSHEPHAAAIGAALTAYADGSGRSLAEINSGFLEVHRPIITPVNADRAGLYREFVSQYAGFEKLHIKTR